MTDFYGKTYRYKGRVIRVCDTIKPDIYMMAYIEGGHKFSPIPCLFDSIEEAQKALDNYAHKKGLLEVQQSGKENNHV